MNKPIVLDKIVPDPNWLAGFISAEECLFINITNSVTYSIGFQVQLLFQITQHSRDEPLMKILIVYFDCGNIYKRGEVMDLKVTKFYDITNKIIPFFQKYPILGVKSKDFEDWCRVVVLMKENKHLTEKGLDQIRKIKAGIYKGRTHVNSVEE